MSTTTKQKPLVPELRFSGFDGGWKCTQLKDMGVYVSDGNYGEMYPKASEMKSFGVPFIRANNMSRGSVVWSDMKYISEKQHSVLTSGHLKSQDILITTRGEIGSVAFVDKEFDGANINAQLCLLRANGELSSKYLFFYLTTSTALKQFKELQTGSALKQLPKGNLAKVNIMLPELAEQQKIADFLGSVDAWLDNLRQQKTALESYKQGMMQKLFTGQVRFKDEGGRNFPEWQEVSMSDIGDSFGGLSGKSGDDFGQGESFITYKQIFDDSVIEPKKFAKVTVAPGEKQNRAQKGDVFFTVSSETPNEVGYASVLMEDVNPYLNSFAFGFRPKSLTDLLPEYSRYHFRSAPFRRQVVRLAQGSTRYNISKVQFMKLIIEIPSASEQQKIADFLTALDQTITTKAEEITRVEKWKKGLMQKMFV